MGMAKQPHVPKFGDWGSEENVPYTAYFDNARKGKTGGKLINPNDPQENPDAISYNIAPQAAPDSDAPLPGRPAASRPKHERRTSREESQFKRATESPARHDAGSHKGFADSPHDRGVNSSDSHRRGGRISGGSDRSIEQSPLHPHHQTRSGGKGGVSSPLWERKGSNEGSHGLGPSTPGRSRLRSVEPPEKETAVPKFGDWDENNPSSADGFTHIFNKVREEKHIGSAKVPVIQTESSYSYGHKQNNDDLESTWCCCFSRSKN